MRERWLPVSGFPKYEVSSIGRLRTEYWHGHIMSPAPNRKGYLHITLRKDGKKITIDVHRLVAAAFIGPPPPDRPNVNHKDGNKANNRWQNLEYCSYAENMAHADEVLGTFPFRGEKHPMVKLTDAQVSEIRKLRINGIRVVEIAQRYGVHISHVYEIIKGRCRPNV